MSTKSPKSNYHMIFSYDRSIHSKVAPISNDCESGDPYDFSGVSFDLEALRSEIYSYSDRILQQSKSGGGNSDMVAVCTA